MHKIEVPSECADLTNEAAQKVPGKAAKKHETPVQTEAGEESCAAIEPTEGLKARKIGARFAQDNTGPKPPEHCAQAVGFRPINGIARPIIRTMRKLCL